MQLLSRRDLLETLEAAKELKLAIVSALPDEMAVLTSVPPCFRASVQTTVSGHGSSQSGCVAIPRFTFYVRHTTTLACYTTFAIILAKRVRFVGTLGSRLLLQLCTTPGVEQLDHESNGRQSDRCHR